MLRLIVVAAILTAAAPAIPSDEMAKAVPPAPWVEDRVFDDVVYFLYTHPARFERFDLDTASWLPTIALPQTPTAFDIDQDGIYLALRSGQVSRFDHYGDHEVPLAMFSDEPATLMVIGDVLYVHYRSPDDEIDSIIKWTGVPIDHSSVHYWMRGLCPAPSLGRIFANLESRPGYIQLGPYGLLGDDIRSHFSSVNLSDSQATWLFPDATLVAYESGHIISTDDLAAVSDFGGEIDGLDFYGDDPIVLRDDTLIAYSPALLRTGEVPLGLTARRFYIHDGTIVVFHLGPTGIETLWTPVAALNPYPAGQPIDPAGLSFTPDDVAMDQRNTIYLLNRTFKSIFRFSMDSGTYLETISTMGARPRMITFSTTDDRLFIGYEDGAIGMVQLSPTGEAGAETPFTSAPATLRGLTTAGEFLFTAGGPSDATVQTHDSNGAVISDGGFRTGASGYRWAPVTRRMYRIDTAYEQLHFDPIGPGGVIGAEVVSPWSSSIRTPIHINPDGTRVLLGSGAIFDGSSLTQVDALGASHLDAIWQGDEIVTLRDDNDNSLLRVYAPDLTISTERTVSGAPYRILPDGMNFVLLNFNSAGRPTYSRWNLDLDSADLTVLISESEGLAAAGSALDYTVSVSALGPGTISNASITSDPSSHLIDLSWTCSATPPSICGSASGTGALNDNAVVATGGTLAYSISATIDPTAVGTARHRVTVQPPIGRRFEDVDLTEIGDPVATFKDGFESGATIAWAGTSP
jgi:hypothetical protein